MRKWVAAIAALFTLAIPAQALAWWDYGHETVAGIAMANAKPQTRAKVAKLLKASPSLGTPGCEIRTLEQAATWPDCLRSKDEAWRWAYSFPWHYQTHNVCKAFDPKENCANGNCISAQITRDLRILKEGKLPARDQIEALAFLAHFVGDVHMPLHSGDHDDAGGNGLKASYGIMPNVNIHSIWDGLLADRAISEEPPLVRAYSAEEKAALGGGTVDDWGRESWELSRRLAYGRALDRDPCESPAPKDPVTFDEDDVQASKAALRERIQQAGLRLARLLDEALG